MCTFLIGLMIKFQKKIEISERRGFERNWNCSCICKNYISAFKEVKENCGAHVKENSHNKINQNKTKT